MGSHFLLQALNSHLLHWQVDSLPLSHQGSPMKGTDLIEWRHREVLWEQEDHRRFLMWPCPWAGGRVCRSPSWLHQLEFNKHHGDPCTFFPLAGALCREWECLKHPPPTRCLTGEKPSGISFFYLVLREWRQREKEGKTKAQTCFVFSKASLYWHKNVIDVKQKEC